MKLNNILDKIKELISHNITENDMYDWINSNINIKKYIPINEKHELIKIFILRFSYKYIDDFMANIDSFSSEYIYTQYEIESKLRLLFKYTNIIFDDEDINEETYDLFMESGLFEYIYNGIKFDYDNFINQIDKATGIYELTIINNLNTLFESNINVDEFLDCMDKFKKLMSNKNIKNNLKFMDNIENMNNPKMYELVNEIDELSLNELKGDNLNKK